MLEQNADYEVMYREFEWRVPAAFNIGVAACDNWAAREPDRIALLDYRVTGEPICLTYGELALRSNALANGLRACGVRRADRVGLLLPQCFATAIAHIAIYKLGAIAVPLALMFGVEALEYRLRRAGVRALVTTAAGHAKLRRMASSPPDLETIVSVDGSEGEVVGLDRILAEHAPLFEPVATAADEPAMMIFTSGTTGPPKGAVHAHRVLLGHVPGVRMHHEFLPRRDDRLWTPADWAWAGGLLNVLLPGLYLGVPVVAGRFDKFEPERVLGLVEKMRVRNAFIPPTALRLLRAAGDIGRRFRLDLRSVGSGGEPLGQETYDWAQRELGLTINEFYGQTECNLVISSCAAIGRTKAGAIGVPVPGHRVKVIDGDGQPVPRGEIGQIAIARPDPVMFLGYWHDPEATQGKFIGDWMVTGDQGIGDGEGFIHFFGRDDDVITSSGYRIGPGEVEDCLTGHPDVALAAVVGKPDPVRTEIVKAYVVLRSGIEPSAFLAGRIRDWVRERLSAHAYPREVDFIDSMPLTTTGKVIRRVLRDRAKYEARQVNAGSMRA